MLDNDAIRNFYSEKLREHGASAAGVGWKDKHAQQIRFNQLVKIIDQAGPFSINDLGCGTGELIRTLQVDFKGSFAYDGYDPLPEMIAEARRQFHETDHLKFHEILSYDDMETSDYTVASGIFNVRGTVPDKEWMSFILGTLGSMDAHSRKGFAFNALTTYSDAHLMRPELFYSDPLFLFDHCKKNFSRDVALLHDYGIYDFTILVRKAG